MTVMTLQEFRDSNIKNVGKNLFCKKLNKHIHIIFLNYNPIFIWKYSTYKLLFLP